MLTLAWTGCNRAEDIPFEDPTSLVVVEGWVSDQFAQQYLRLSRTVPFTSGEPSEIVSDAEVVIFVSTNQLEQIPMTYSFDQESKNYLSDSLFAGQAGASYTLRITLTSGQTIVTTAPEIMKAVRPIDTLFYNSFLRESEENPNVEIEVFYPIARTSDPPNDINYYRWKLYRNDTLFADPQDIFLFNDRFLESAGSYPQQFTGYDYRLNDMIRVERMEISQGAYRFLSLLKSQTTSLGTNTAVAPASIIGNLSYTNSGEDVLGYFGTFSITSRVIRIER